MPSASDTAYPRLKANPTAKELDEIYTPNIFELVFADKRTRQPAPRIGLLLLLKTFQRLGYFVRYADIPQPIVRHIAQSAGHSEVPERNQTEHINRFGNYMLNPNRRPEPLERHLRNAALEGVDTVY